MINEYYKEPTKIVQAHIPESLHNEFKMATFYNGESIKVALETMIKDYIRRTEHEREYGQHY